MARPKNEKLRVEIADVAARQFAERGYDATSYTSIADECGISRNLAQYHWPKKELLAIKYMEDLLSQCVAELGFSEEELLDDYDRIAAVGTRFFTTLLAEEGTRLFLKDIIASRDLTEAVLAFNLEWAISHVRSTDYDSDATQRTVISSMGGFYDLLHWCLKHDQPMDVEAEIVKVVSAFHDAIG